MGGLLDLCLTLTPPPADAPQGTIASVELRCDALGLQSFAGQLLSDPLSSAEREELTWYLEHYWQWPYEEFARRGQRVEQLLIDAGKRLYQAVFGSAQAMSIVQPWRLQPLLQPEAQRQITIISTVPQALSLPWELLHDEQGFLVLRTKQPVSIIRRLPQTELGALPTQFAPPLRVLLVTARPDDAGFVDPRGIAHELLDEVQPQIEAGKIALEFLRLPTLVALRERLSQEPPIHILHFDGHGTFDEATASADSQRLQGGAQGKLAFEDDEGKVDLIEAERLGQVLQASGVRLAVLTACQSAKGAADDLFSSVAARLISSGVDGVVAMSASVLVVSAARYVEAFYRHLAAGDAVTLAHERARQALYDQPNRHLHRRRRDEAGAPIKLKDWWLPHFYQQRSINFVAGQAINLPMPAQPADSNQIAPSQKPGQTDSLTYPLPPPPRYSFTGRARELHKIGRWLMSGKAVVIHGFGGVGKTALARETAEWFTRTGMYAGVCFVSFEHGGDAAVLLSVLGHQLNVYTGDYDPRDTDAAIRLLRPALRERRTIMIADNLESILPRGDTLLEAAARAQLWDVLLKLTQTDCGVLLTSRDANFGDGRMAHGADVKHLPLGGLHPEDAYTLASYMLKELDIEQARAPYSTLRDLLEQLDHHPHAIQLVLPVLRETGMTLNRISEEFSALLPQFTDDRETGRNRSLLASLEYSLRRLPKLHQQLLVRLALFEGGASEDNLLAITEIEEEDWDRLRQALDQAALIVPEWIGNFSRQFLHFHPVLAPYLRAQPCAKDEALRSRYAARYHVVARILYYEDTRDPLTARKLARRELPNLRRTMELLLVDDTLDEASELAGHIAHFLNIFGLWRECDELRCRVAQAVQVAGGQTSGALTWAEYMRESGLGEDELTRGTPRAAYDRFTALLERIEAVPAGAPLGQGSYGHCQTLGWLARCLQADGQHGMAEGLFRHALAVIDALVAAQPDDQNFVRQRSVVLTDLGNVLLLQGKYAEAQAVYEAGLEIVEQLGDTRSQGVVLGQLGTLALRQADHAVARQRYLEALKRFQELGEPAMEALYWHQLGRVAEEQRQWAEAEIYYRASLEIKDRHGDTAGGANTCNQLAIVAKNSNRPTEAEGWYKRALNVPDLPPSKVALFSNNLASLLKDEVRAGRMPPERLAEARDYAERALTIDETLDASTEIWMTLFILADIAELESDTQAARLFRRRARESFAAFAGNRYYIDQRFGDFIAAIAASVGSEGARAAMEAGLPEVEAKGWRISPAIHGIWAGERDWHALAEDLDSQWQALLVLRVLETIAGQSGEASIGIAAAYPQHDGTSGNSSD